MKPSYEQLERLGLEQQSTILNQQIVIDILNKAVIDLKTKVEQLEDRLNKNSRNSSKPPSGDPKPNHPKKDPSVKRQAHHPGVNRQPLPDGMVTSKEKRIVATCPRCRSTMEPTGESKKWQQIELPELKPLVHEIELCICKCTKCHLEQTPELAQHETYLMGPRLESFVNVLMAQFRHSHLGVRALIDLMIPGLTLSQGLISKAKKRAAQAFDSATEQLTQELLKSLAPKNVDVTGWRHEGQNGNALILRNPTLLRYFLIEKQNGETLAELLPGSHKLIVDRGLAIQKLETQSVQYCLAHLLRNLEGLGDSFQIRAGETQQVGELHETVQMLFHDQHRYNAGEISLSTLKHYGYTKWAWMKEVVEDLLESASKTVRRFCKRLLKDWKRFMVYLSQAGPMTNNLAEEGLRNLVIARKLCFGSRSSYGRRWREVMHSCVETLKRQGKSVMDFFAETIRAWRTGTPCPKIV